MTALTTNLSLSLQGFSLQVSDSLKLDGITALFGPSGAGKTTLLRIIAGLEDSSVGHLALGDEVWQDSERGIFIPPYERRIGYVFQDGRLFSHLSVEKNLIFSRKRAREQSKSAHLVEMGEVIESLELQSLLPRIPDSLSGGERQRVAMGRALLNSPQVLLLDEPLSALDLRRKAEIIPYIERLAADFRIPVLYVTHNVEEVARLARTMVLLADGRIAAMGETAEVLERVELWSLTGRLEAGAVLQAKVGMTKSGMTSLNVEGESLRIPAIDAPPETLVRLRVQAKEVALSTQRPQHLSIRNVLSTTILRIDVDETVFAEILLDVGGQHLRSRVTREAVEELELEEGQRIFALIKSVSFEGRLLS